MDWEAQVVASIAAREPINDDERVSIERVLAEFERLDDPFDEDRDPTHVTGSAIVVGDRGVVILRHKRLGLWLQPGGHLDAGETPWDAAKREAEEETGLDVEFVNRDAAGIPALVHVDVHPAGRGHIHLDLRYVVRAGHDDPCPPAGESQEIGWFDWPEAIAKVSDDRLRALLVYLAPR